MAYQKRPYGNNLREKTIKCSCGSTAKLTSKKNYPFGKKSKPVTSTFYRCLACKKMTFITKDAGGKK